MSEQRSGIRVALIGPESRVYHPDEHCSSLKRDDRYWPVHRGMLQTSQHVNRVSETLLDVIAGGATEGYFEIRCLHPSIAGVKQAWFPLNQRQRCIDYALSNRTVLDVYVGVAPRTHEKGGREAIEHVWCLWVDCDTPEAVDRLHEFEPHPSFVVCSGSDRNCHAYWSLDQPLSPLWAERANRRLAGHLGADIKVADAARILRVPDTLNHKMSPPAPVIGFENHALDGTEYKSSDILRAVGRLPDPEGARPAQSRPRPDVASDDPLLGVSADRFYHVLTGREVTRGNVTCPFHNDGKERSPSMRLYDTTFYCFGCQRGGSVYEFGAELWGLGTRGADFLALRDRLCSNLRV